MSQVLPLELIDKCIGSKIHVIMKSDREVVAVANNERSHVSENGPDGLQSSTQKEILLNGTQIAILVPGGEGPEADQ
eukprot:gene3625-8324_t